MAKKVAFVNLKGGVGKTALSTNFAFYCSEILKKKTLLVDLDPQTNATFACMTPADWKVHDEKHGTLADLLSPGDAKRAEGGRKRVQDVIKKSIRPNLDILPATLTMYTLDFSLAGTSGRERKLKKALESIESEYEYIVCDCPPNLNVGTQNALFFSDYFVVPVSPDFLSALGIGLLLGRLNDICEDLDHEIKNLGIVISRVGRPSLHREEIITTLKSDFEELVVDHQIKERSSVGASVEGSRSVFEGNDQQAKDEFTAVFKELIRRIDTNENS